jgi:hypothetical protein
MGVRASEIVSGLWQGGWPPPGRWLAERGFSTLVLCAEEYQPPFVCPEHVAATTGMWDSNPWPGVEVIYVPLNDDETAQIEKPPRETLRLALRAGRIVATRLGQRSKVLVTCWQGRNRSGLVSALSLHFHLGISGSAAKRIVQERRPYALRNPVFNGLLRNLRRPDHHLAEAVLASPAAIVARFQVIPARRAP